MDHMGMPRRERRQFREQRADRTINARDRNNPHRQGGAKDRHPPSTWRGAIGRSAPKNWCTSARAFQFYFRWAIQSLILPYRSVPDRRDNAGSNPPLAPWWCAQRSSG